MQWFVLLPHREKVLVFNLEAVGVLCVEFARFSVSVLILSGYSGFLLQSMDMDLGDR